MRTWKPTFKRAFDHHLFTGVVEEAGKNLETRVSGGGGGGSSYGGTGYTAPVSISSTTVVHDQLFLTADDGRERAFKLTDFDVACRRGNHVTVHWAIPTGKKEGAYVAVVNHTTTDSTFESKALHALFLPKWKLLTLALVTPLAAVLFFDGLIAGGAAGGSLFLAWRDFKKASLEMNEFKEAVRVSR